MLRCIAALASNPAHRCSRRRTTTIVSQPERSSVWRKRERDRHRRTGLYWALVGSRFDNGLVYGGVALAVGPDVQILGTGFFDPSGTVAVPFTPPLGNGLDVFFLQAVSASSPNFLPPSPSNSVALRPRGFYTDTPRSPPASAPAPAGSRMSRAP